VAEATPGPTGVAGHPLIFNFFNFYNLGWRYFGKKIVKIIKLQKFESLGGALQKLKH
jgi:hypothetical protein